ncbi:MAG: ATP-binding protein [bacterium]
MTLFILFEKFYRVKSRESSGVPGTGLGLWLTKQLCEKMKGEIFIESMSGVGSKFTVIFPLFKAGQGEEKNAKV